MRTLIKVIVIVLVLAVAALAAIPFVVDPNDYKDEIAIQVEKATGRQLSIQGDIGLSVFPWIALELGKLSLSNASGFKADSFAQVKSAQIRIKLLPLLKKELEMDTIILDGLVLNLETDKNGNTNWQDLAKAGDKGTESANVAPEATKDAPPALAAISIAGVQLSNANILWSNAQTNENYQLRNLNLETDPLIPGEPTALNMDFDVISAKPEVKAHITLATQIMVDLQKQQYQLNDLQLTTLAEAKELPVDTANITVNADIAADMVKQMVTLRDFTMETIASNAEQKVTAKLSGIVDANLDSKLYSVENLSVDGNISAPALPGGRANIKLSTDLSADLAKQTLSLADLAVQVQDLMLNGKIDARNILAEKPDFTGNIQIKPFNLRKLAADMNIELPAMADNSTLENVALQTQLAGSNNHINATGLQLTLDQSQLSGQFGIENFAQPAYRFDLSLDEIDADRYLPPVKEDADQQTAPPASAAAGGAAELPLDTLRQINAQGSLKIGKLKASGITSENVLVTIDAKNGLIKLNPMQADLYQGTYRGNVSVDARGELLKLAIDEKLAGIQAGPLLKDLTGDDKISGKADASVKLNGSGKDIDAIKRTLDGNGNFSFTDGALKGINIGEIIRKAKAALSGQKLPDSDAPEATDFSSLTGSFTADNGIISNDDLQMMSPLLRVNGKGTASLPKETIDYSLKVAIVGSAKGQGGKELEELKGVTIPIKITGTFNEPKPSVDLAAIVKEQAGEELKAKAEEKLKEELGDDLGGLLGGALGGKKATDDSATQTEPDAQPTTDGETTEEQPSAEEQLKEDVKNKLKGLF